MSLKNYNFYSHFNWFNNPLQKKNYRRNFLKIIYILLFSVLVISACTFLPDRPKPTVGSPKFNLSSGIYTDVINVSISSSTDGVKIIYTTDGSNPTESNGLIYSGSISVYKTTTIKAVAVKDLWNDSAVSTGQYIIIGDVAVKHGTQILSDPTGNHNIVTNTINNDIETTFVIENVGNSLFAISDLTVDSTSDYYSVSLPASMEIPSGLSVPFTVTFKPLDYITTTATVTIYSDDLDDGEYVFTITGIASSGSSNSEIDLKIDGTYRSSGYILNFGSVNVGDESSLINFKIENNGTSFLELTGSETVRIIGTDPGSFIKDISGLSTIIDADESDDFTIKFVPLKDGALTAEMQIENNDSDESLYTITLQGTGVDNTGPDTSPGTLTVSKLRSNKLTLSWAKAIDDVSPQPEIEYLAYYSTSSSMTNVSDIETNGTAVGTFTEDISSVNISSLDDDTDYYFNVIVKDELNNKSCYTMQTQRTKEKVHLVYDIKSSGGSNPSDFAVFNGNLYFSAEGDTLGNELWVYDDNNDPANDRDINTSGDSNPTDLTVFNSYLYFGASDGSNGQELWKYDGTSAPSMVYNISSGSGSSNPEEMIEFNSKLYFRANDGSYGVELWEYDGTLDPSRISDIYSSGSSSNPEYLTVYNSNLYFRADNGTSKLWSYDGVSTLTEHSVTNPMHMEVYNSLIHMNTYFIIGNYYNELGSYNGSGTATLVYDINSNNKADSSPAYLTVYDSKLYFSADDGSNGMELWVYDGIASPSMVYDINTSGDSNPSHLIVFDGNLYFRATDGANGIELWEYTGSGAPTMVKDINISGNSNPQGFIIYNNNLYFSADDNSNGVELWRYEP